jgi:hypothetical protein
MKCGLQIQHENIFILMIKQGNTTHASAAIGTVNGLSCVAAAIAIALMLCRNAEAAGG